MILFAILAFGAKLALPYSTESLRLGAIGRWGVKIGKWRPKQNVFRLAWSQLVRDGPSAGAGVRHVGTSSAHSLRSTDVLEVVPKDAKGHHYHESRSFDVGYSLAVLVNLANIDRGRAGSAQ